MDKLLGKFTPSNDEDNLEEDSDKPLAKLDEATKLKEKESNAKQKMDTDILNQLIKTGDNTDGMFVDKKDKDKDGDSTHENVDKDAELKGFKIENPKGKYAKQFQDDMLKNPSKYKISTPKGEMSIAEAMRKGYNPITKRFRPDKDVDNIKNKAMESLNDEDKKTLDSKFNKDNLNLADADAQEMGLQKELPVKEGLPGEQMPEGQVPGEQNHLQQQQMPQGIEALLGGGK